MDIEADENTAPSSLERVLRHLETRVLDCNLGILSRALLISTLGEANNAQFCSYGLLALSPFDLARRAAQCSTEAEPEWEHVGALEVTLCRDWLLFEGHVADVYLDLFHERGPTRPPRHRGRVCVAEVEELMWPTWIRAWRVPAKTDRGTLDALPGGLSRPCLRCQEPPCQERFIDVTLRTKVLQIGTAAREALRHVCIATACAMTLGALCFALGIIFISILGLIPSPGFIFFLCCLPALLFLVALMHVVDFLLNLAQ